MALVYFNSLERQPLNRGCISPASHNREILEKSIFLQDFWISAVSGEMHFTASRGNLSIGVYITRFAKSGNPREIYFSPRFLDFRRRRGDAF